MPIVTDFKFAHRIQRQTVFAAQSAQDFRGDLVNFLTVGADTGIWSGTGFNMIWRPDFGRVNGNPNDFFLELNETLETLSFKDITGGVPGRGIANRGAVNPDIQLGGIAYTQEISDANDTETVNGVTRNAGLHFEPGVWVNVVPTDNPKEPGSVARMGTVPHGTTINLQGASLGAFENAAGIDMTQIIKPSSITPSKILTDPSDESQLVHFNAQETIDSAQPDGPSRTPVSKLKQLDQAHLTDPHRYLFDALAGQTITKLVTLIVASDPRARPGKSPEVGGGIDNIAFLQGTTAPNANVTPASSIFWIEEGTDAQGYPLRQLQYTQRVLLKFNGLNWPHVTVGTLRLQ